MAEARIEGETVWVERTAGEGTRVDVVEMPEAEDFEHLTSEPDGPKTLLLVASSFARSDWFDLPEGGLAAFGAPERRRVTHRFRAACWCGCGTEDAWHLHGSNAGVIECRATGQFKFYDAFEFRTRHPSVALATAR